MTFFYRYDKKKESTSVYDDGFFSCTDTSMTVNTTKTFDIEAVIDPKTKEEIPAKEAVQRGIIDEATGKNNQFGAFLYYKFNKKLKYT